MRTVDEVRTVDELDGYRVGDRVVVDDVDVGTIVALTTPFYAFVLIDGGPAIDTGTDHLFPAD